MPLFPMFDGAPRRPLQLRINDDGVFLGDALLVRSTERLSYQDADRLIALVTIALRRTISADVIGSVAAAAKFWALGESAVANLRLLYADLPPTSDPTIGARLQLAGYCLDNGMSPSALMTELGLAWSKPSLSKYDVNQPRVPTGSGRTSGRWMSLLEGLSESLNASFLARVAPSVVAALSRFAANFSTPTAVMGALFVPTPNSGGVTSGTLPGAPDISFEKDDPAGRLRLSTTRADGSSVRVETQLRGGIYIDVATGIPLGRDLDGQLYLDFDAVRQVIEDTEPRSAKVGPDEKAKAGADEANFVLRRRLTHHIMLPPARRPTRSRCTSA